MFDVHWDRERRVVGVTTRGFLSVQDARAFWDDFMPRLRAFRASCGPVAVFADMTASPIQSAEVNAVTEEMVGHLAAYAGGPFVFVVNSTLGKLQADRVFARIRPHTFLTAEEAKTWLATTWRGAEDPGSGA